MRLREEFGFIEQGKPQLIEIKKGRQWFDMEPVKQIKCPPKEVKK
jgi:hypothetical protein